MAAPKHNNNALKDEPASSFLHLRCTRAEKAAWVKEARFEGKKLSEWVTRILNYASGIYDEINHRP